MQKKVVVITGASGGIGRATALLFAARGALVIAVGRDESKLDDLKSVSKNDGANIETRVADICQTSEVEQIINKTAEDFGQIDVLVNAAGIILNGTIENTALADWDKMMDINLRALFFFTQKCVPHLEKTKGNVINVSSVSGLRSFPNVLAYCVSKAAVDQLTRCAALELAPKGVRVNAVNPGVVVTELHKRGGMAEKDYEQFLKNSEKTHPLGRVGKPEDVADLIYFLASEKASWITGVTYEIDGGRGQTCAR